VVRVPLVAAEGSCFPAGEPSTLDVVGDGYSVSVDFVATDVGQGSCELDGGLATVDASTPAG